MPAGVVKTAEDERLWDKAKRQAQKQGRAGDYAYITGIFKQMKGGSGLGKSYVVPPPFRLSRIPGQVPRRNQQSIERLAIRRLAEQPAPRFKAAMLLDHTEPRLTVQSIVSNLGLGRETEKSWCRFLQKALQGSSNEMTVRRELHERMREEGLEPELRKVLFQRSMSYWRGRMTKSLVQVVSADDLRATPAPDLERMHLLSVESLHKADARGGKYHRRVPGEGGKGFRYYYDPERYARTPGAHVSGREATEAAIKKGVGARVEKAGKNGCRIEELESLVKRYGAKAVGSVLQQACSDGGSMKFKNGRLYLAKSRRLVPRSA